MTTLTAERTPGVQSPMPVAAEAREILARLGVSPGVWTDGPLLARSPITGETIGRLTPISAAESEAAIERAQAAFLQWRKVPAPRRGLFRRHP